MDEIGCLHDVDVDIQLVPKTDKERFDSHFRKGD